MTEVRDVTRLPDRAQLLAETFARLRWCVGGEFSVSLSPEMCGVLLEAMQPPMRSDLAWLNALDLAASYYRRELVEILADCDHDKPDIAKIQARAESAIQAADAALRAVAA